MASALEVRNVSVEFGGIAALTGVNLTAEAGAVTGIMGPNGAGKTTLFNVISGLTRPNTGAVFIDGKAVTHLPASARAKRGLSRTFQRLELFGSLTAIENVMVGAEARRGVELRPRERALELLALVGIADDSTALASALPTGKARLVELARALSIRPKVLLLDEPASGLDQDEGRALAELLGRLAEGDCAVVLVDHDVELMMSVCDTITVLDAGKVIARGSPEDLRVNETVRAAYLGPAVELGS